MKRTKKNRQADCLQTEKRERTAARAAKCTTDYNQENTGGDFRKDKSRDKPLSTFLQASEIKTRQCIYISREIHEKVAIVASRMGNGLSIGKFVDNILRDHFRQYGTQYTEQIENAKKSETMTKVFLIVSVACNVWFLSLLLYDRIMETKLIRFFRHIAGLWRSLDSTVAEQGKDKETPPTDTSDIIGKSRFKMAPTRTKTAIPTQEAATSEKGIELSEEEATFDDGNTETASRPRQIPEDKLDETFMSISPSELEYGEDDPEDEEPDKKQASGSSFEDIDIAVRAIRKDSPSDEEMRHAGKVMTELDGTELFTRITERLTDEAMSERLAKAMSVFVDTVNMTVTRQKEKVFVIPDNIEEFDFRNYV